MNLRDRCKELTLDSFPARLPLVGRYRDVDARNHINNIAVVELFSEARSQFILSLLAGIKRTERQFFVVGQQAVFYAGEAHFPGKIEIGIGLFAIGRSTLRFGQAFFNEGHCTAIAEAVLVFSSSGRAQPLPPSLRDHAQEYLFDPGNAPPRQLIAPDSNPLPDGPITP